MSIKVNTRAIQDLNELFKVKISIEKLQFTEPKRFIRRRENRLSQSFPTTNSFDNNLSLGEGKVLAI